MIDWDRVRDHLQPAIDRCGGTHTFEDVVDEIERGDMQLWTADAGSIVTSITTYPRKRIIQIFLAGGEMAQVLDFLPSIEAFAKAWGCAEMTCSGRYGWVRVLQPRGWTKKGIMMGVEI